VSGPIILPADCETAIDALDRAYNVHIANASTPWLDEEFRRAAAVRACFSEAGIEIICGLMKIHQNHKPKKKK